MWILEWFDADNLGKGFKTKTPIQVIKVSRHEEEIEEKDSRIKELEEENERLRMQTINKCNKQVEQCLKRIEEASKKFDNNIKIIKQGLRG